MCLVAVDRWHCVMPRVLRNGDKCSSCSSTLAKDYELCDKKLFREKKRPVSTRPCTIVRTITTRKSCHVYVISTHVRIFPLLQEKRNCTKSPNSQQQNGAVSVAGCKDSGVQSNVRRPPWKSLTIIHRERSRAGHPALLVQVSSFGLLW